MVRGGPAFSGARASGPLWAQDNREGHRHKRTPLLALASPAAMRHAKAGRRPARHCYHQSDFGVRVQSPLRRGEDTTPPSPWLVARTVPRPPPPLALHRSSWDLASQSTIVWLVVGQFGASRSELRMTRMGRPGIIPDRKKPASGRPLRHFSRPRSSVSSLVSISDCGVFRGWTAGAEVIHCLVS